MIKPEYAVTADGRQLDAAAITDSYIKAVNINRNIIVNAQTAQMSLYEVCKGLKEMRDEKLYKELGYQNFEEYTEKEVGIKRRQAYKMIDIVEKLPTDFVHPGAHLGVSKLYLLSTLSEEERTEITENTDLETVSKRELEEKVKEIKSLREKLDEQNSENVRIAKQRETLISQRDKLEGQISDLEKQIEELENRPIDVAVCESDSHEIENLKNAMKTCDDRWAKKYGEMEEENIKLTRQLHQDYKAQIDQLTAGYEKKLSEVAATSEAVPEQIAVPDMKETFKAYYSMAYNAFDTMAEFVKKQPEKDRQFFLEKSDELINIVNKSIQEVKKNVKTI